MLFTRSLLFAALHFLSVIFFSIFALILWPLPFQWRYKLVSQWAVFNLWLLKVICGIRYEVEGGENIPDEPCIISRMDEKSLLVGPISSLIILVVILRMLIKE